MCSANFYVCWFFVGAKGLYEIMRYDISNELIAHRTCLHGKKEEGTR